MTQNMSISRAVLTIVGFGLFFAWQNAAVSFLFPSSADLGFSPLAAGDVSASLLLVFCLVSYRKDRAAFSPTWMLELGALAILISTIAIVLLSRTLLPLWGIYLAALVVGFSVSAMAYVWATALVNYSRSDALWCACTGMLVGIFVDYLFMNGAELGIPVLVSLAGAGSLICFMASMRKVSLESSPLLIRPKHPSEFAKLAAGIALFAIALGIVAGTTANGCTEEIMRTINESIAKVGMAISLVLVVILAIGRKRIQTLTLLKGFAVFVLAVILLNIVWLDLAPIWLSATLFAWQMLKVFVLLVLVGTHRRTIVSLSFLFPAAWGVLDVGHAIGVVVGQMLIPLGGNDSQSLMNSVVLVAFLVAIAAILLLSNKVIWEAAGTSTSTGDRGVGEDAAETVSQPEVRMRASAVSDANEHTSVDEAHDQVLDPHAARCAELARRYRLTERESEVFRYLAQGHTRASIAKRLFVSENTVREHVKSIYKKLHIHSKQQLIDMVDSGVAL